MGQKGTYAAGNVSPDVPGHSGQISDKRFHEKKKTGDSEEIKAPNAAFVFGRVKLLHAAQKITGMLYQVSQNSNPSILEIQVAHLGANGVAQ